MVMNAFSDILMITPLITPLITPFTPKFPQAQLQRDQHFFPPKPGPSFGSRFASFRLISSRFVFRQDRPRAAGHGDEAHGAQAEEGLENPGISGSVEAVDQWIHWG